MQDILKLIRTYAGSKWVIGPIDGDPIFESRRAPDAFCEAMLLADVQEAMLAKRWGIVELVSGSGLSSILMLFSKAGGFLGTAVVAHDDPYIYEKSPRNGQ